MAGTAYTQPGFPWENGCCESIEAGSDDQMFNGGIFYSLSEAQALSTGRRQHQNTKRPNIALSYRLPALEAIVPMGPNRVIRQRSIWTFLVGSIMAR